MTTATSTSKPATGRKSTPQSPRESIKTWTFDSVGDKKYALQLQRAYNGNPCLRIVQGSLQDDGSYRKFDITIWSVDFTTLFENLKKVSAYIVEHKIHNPPNHVYRPRPKPES